MVATALQSQLPDPSSTSYTAGSANVAQTSTLATPATQPTAAEQQRISDLQEQFQQQAQQDPAGFRSAMRAAFGDKASLAQIDQLLDLALAGKLPMPANIQFVEAGSLGSDALGAYDASNGGSLYLDRSLLSDPDKLQSVFNEEMGHHLDALLGGADAAGDEGAVFSRTLEQGKLSQSELTALKNEDDHGVILIEGRSVQVEFSEEGSDDAGGDGGEESSTSDSTDSGASECSADSGSGNTGGTGESQNDSDTDSGGSTESDVGEECSVEGDNGNGGAPGTDGPEDEENKSDSHENGNSESDKAGGKEPLGNEPLNESKPERDINDSIGNARTGMDTVDALNDIAAEGNGDLPDDIQNMNKTLGTFAKAASRALSWIEPVVSFVGGFNRAKSERAGGNPIVEGTKEALKGVDNALVGIGVGVTTTGGTVGNVAAGVVAGVVVENAYDKSAFNEGVDEGVDTVVDTVVDGTNSVPNHDGQGYGQSPLSYFNDHRLRQR